jgi:hypothetical protein
MIRRFALLLALAASLTGCASVSRVDAAADVHALLIAIRDNDQAAFDARVDRPALSRQIEGFIMKRASDATADNPMMALGLLLAGPASQLIGDAMLQPSVFRIAAGYYGYTPDKPIPGRMAIASTLRSIGPGEVCATRSRNGPSLLTFALRGETWRLVRFDGELSDLRL